MNRFLEMRAITISAMIAGSLYTGCIDPAAAQNVTVIGPITPGHCSVFSSTTVLKDSGGSCGGSVNLAPNTTIISPSVNGGLLYDNSGVLADSLTLPGAYIWNGLNTFNAALTYGGVTLSNSVTGTGSMVLSTSPTIITPSFTFGTGSNSFITAGSINTGFQNQISAVNNGTVSNAGTIASFNANLAAGTNTYLQMQVAGGATPAATIQSGSGMTGGMTIGVLAGTLNIGAFTLGGTVSGGGNQINNVIIGTTTPLAGNFTTLNGTSEVITGGNLASGANAFNVTGTLSPTSALQYGAAITITSSGTDTNGKVGLIITLSPGFTGAGNSQAFQGVNTAAGTGTTLIPASGSNLQILNMGGADSTTGTTAGYNVGMAGKAANSSALNAGVLGLAQISTNSAALNIGGVFSAVAATNNIGVFASLNQTAVPAVSAALVADNGVAATQPIALFRANAVTVAQVTQVGLFSAPTYISSGAVPTGTTGTCVASSFAGGSTAGTFSAALCTATNTFILSALPTAPNGYSCDAFDRTTSTAKLRQTNSSATSATLTVDVATVASDVVQYKCIAY